MAAFNGCKGTIYYGEEPDEMLGVSTWALTESPKDEEEYADNTTGCASATNVGAISRTVDFSVNMQDGEEDKGKPPVRAGREYAIELHIDDSGENYWSGTVIILSMTYTVDINTAALVAAEYSARFQGAMVGNGTLEDSES